jgi:dihydrofolate reductase
VGRMVGRRPAFHMPVVIVTHHAREPVTKEGGTTFAFVSDGIESALEQARERPAVGTWPSAVARTSRSNT